MKIYEGVYQRPGHPLDGQRVRVVGVWEQQEFTFPGGEKRLVWTCIGLFKLPGNRFEHHRITRGQLRPLRADERPSYIESPEQAFAGLTVPAERLHFPRVRFEVVTGTRVLEEMFRTNQILADLPFKRVDNKESEMKNRKHVDLMHSLQEDLATVEAYFPENGQTSKGYTYKVPVDWNVRGGDQLVVDTPSGETKVVMVREAHRTPQLDGGYDYKWAVAKVDRAEHCQLVNRDAKFLDEMAEVERLNRRKSTLQDAREKLGANTAARKRFDHAVKMLGGA